MNWLHHHLNSFARPVLGRIPRCSPSDRSSFSPHEFAIIKNLWRSIKAAADGKPILLPGRDVWIFEVLARRENFPTVFRPDISRLTVKHVAEDYSNHFVFDTGFIGSIPIGLKAQQFKMASSQRIGIGAGSPFLADPGTQTFPRMKGARGLALKIEGTPKYHKRGFLKHQDHCSTHSEAPGSIWSRHYATCTCAPTITQELSDLAEFERAAKLTIAVYTNNAPRFVEGPLLINRW